MAERAVEETAAHLPVTILRPSIIESALEQPFPGWIEGFKMAEPIILAYGRGDLPEFPGIPDGVIDIIPVDLVVNATIAAAAQLPEPGNPAYYTICSGARNPLSLPVLYELVREYFLEHPMVQRDRGEVKVPTWNWPGSARVGQLIQIGERAQRTADRVVTSLPRSERTRDWAQSLDRQKRPARLPAPLLRPLPALRRGRAALRRQRDPRSCTTRCTRTTRDGSASTQRSSTGGTTSTSVHVPAVVAPLTALHRDARAAA